MMVGFGELCYFALFLCPWSWSSLSVCQLPRPNCHLCLSSLGALPQPFTTIVSTGSMANIWGRSTVSVSVLLPCFHFLLRCPRYRRVFQVLFLYLCLLWMHFCIVKMFTFFKNLHWLPLSLFSPFLLLLFLSASSTHMASIFMLIVFYQILFTSITLPTSSSLLLIVLKCYLILLISIHSALWSLYISIHSFASRHSFESWHSYLLYLLDG